MYSARLTITGYSVGFATECEGAFRYITSIDHLFDFRPYEATVADLDQELPTLHYRDADRYSVEFDPETRTLHLSFPWNDDIPELFNPGEPFHHLLLYPIRFLLETLRQEASEYTLHASTVVRDGRAILIAGEAEAGKTTTALHLCRTHGFSIYANDQPSVAMRGGIPWVVRGEPTVNLRLSSTEEYSAALAARVFGSSARRSDDWEVQQEVPHADLGLDVNERPAPVAMLVKIKLDRRADECVVRFFSPDGAGRARAKKKDEFFAKLTLYHEITETIRGAAFTPLREDDLSLAAFFPPSLDQPRFVEQRARFVNTVFEGGDVVVVSVRGPLEESARRIVELFEEGGDAETAVPDRARRLAAR
jgi:hypothetical protein